MMTNKKEYVDKIKSSSELEGIYAVIGKHDAQMLEITKRLEMLEDKAGLVKDLIKLNSNDWREKSGEVIIKIASALGGKQYIAELRKESYRLLEKRVGLNLEVLLENKRKQMIEKRIGKTIVNRINNLDLIAADEKLVKEYISVLKYMIICYMG